MDIKVLFAFYPLYVNYNYGVALLSSLCGAFDIETDVYLLDNLEKFTKYINQNQFNYIGFSCVTKHDYIKSLPFMLAASRTGVPTMLGGVYPRMGLPMGAPVNLICRGEGELLPLFFVKGSIGVFETPQIYPDLNELLLPDYELFKNIPYNRELPLGSWKKAIPYSSSRGCPYRCRFCAVSYQAPGVRVRTKINDDLARIIQKYKPDVIHFLDELIPYYDEKWRESWGDLQFPFVAYIRADITSPQLVWLKDHGMAGCFFGVESGNERYRNDVLGKNLDNVQIQSTVGLLKEMKMPFIVSYMRGMPGETWEMQAETVKYSKELGGFPVIYNYENLVGA